MSYDYKQVEVVRVIDGDTVVLNIDMGNHIHWKRDFRLRGIDTPERSHAGFVEATERLRELLANGISRTQTYKPSKFGGWLCEIFISVEGGEMLVNQMMVNEGHAVPYDGGKKA